MWKSDNPFIRLAKMFGGLLGVAILVLLWPTIVFSFPTKSDYPNSTATVHSCVDTGPLSRRGFGHNWDCVATIRDDKTGRIWTASIDMNLFTPNEIGTPQRMTWGYGGSRSSINTEKRTYTQAEGYSRGTVGFIAIVSSVCLGIPALWLLAVSIVWAFPKEGQRKFWEKIHGTPEERAAKKKKEAELRERFRREQERREQARRQRKANR